VELIEAQIAKQAANCCAYAIIRYAAQVKIKTSFSVSGSAIGFVSDRSVFAKYLPAGLSTLARESVSDGEAPTNGLVAVSFGIRTSVEASAFLKSPLLASKTFIKSSKSSALFNRAETSIELDTTETR
jgi:hypothetical protein